MTPKITDEQRRAFALREGGPVPVEDDQTQRVYVIVDQHMHERAMQALREQEDIESIERGIQQMEAGDGRPVAEADAAMRQKLRFPPRTSVSVSSSPSGTRLNRISAKTISRRGRNGKSTVASVFLTVISGKPDGTLKVEGADGATYWIMTEDALHIRNEVLKGIEAAERRDVAEWNPDEIKRKGRLSFV